MAVEQGEVAEPATLDGLTREQWIEARAGDFAANPALRDRAIAMLLHDSLMLSKSFADLAQVARKEGLGGMIKAVMGAMNGR